MTKTTADTIGNRIRTARERAGITQMSLAHGLSISLQTLGSWEHDRTEPRAGDLLRLGAALAVRPEWILTGAGRR